MLTAGEWEDDFWKAAASQQVKGFITAVQEDAYKQGMTDAAECCKGWVLAEACETAILKKRDKTDL